MSYNISLSIFFILILSGLNNAYAKNKNMQMNAGLWEGINETNWEFKLLEITSGNEHRLWEAPIHNAFNRITYETFSNKDIQCEETHCSILIKVRGEKNQFKKLLVTKTINEQLTIIEIDGNSDNSRILADNYVLSFQKTKSTVRKFIDMYRDRVEELFFQKENGLYGFWIGIMKSDFEVKLISLEAYPDRESVFTKFTPGYSFTSQTSFEPVNVEHGKDLIKIETNDDILVRQVHLTLGSNGQLRGAILGQLRNELRINGEITLKRVDWRN